MSALRNAEGAISGFFDRIFGRMFRGNVEPVELARKLAREMEDHKTVSVTRVYVPNEYVIYLSPKDMARFASFEGSLTQELANYVSERARHEGFTLLSDPLVRLEEDPDLTVGAYGIACRVVDLPADGSEPVVQRPAPDASAVARPDVPFAPYQPDAEPLVDDVADDAEAGIGGALSAGAAAGVDAELADDLARADDEGMGLPDAVELDPVDHAEPGADAAADSGDLVESGDDGASDAADADAPMSSEPEAPEPAEAPAPVTPVDDPLVLAEPAAAARVMPLDEPEPVAAVPPVDAVPPVPGVPPVAATAPPVPTLPPAVAPPTPSAQPPPTDAPEPPAPPRPLPEPGGYEPLAGVSGTQIFSPASSADDNFVQEEVSLIIGGRRFRLAKRTTVIGRGRDCDIAVSDPNASRQHAEIRHIGLDYFLVDLGSTNGTYVNGQRIRRHAIADGDRITIGTTEMIVEHLTGGGYR